ncbi:uncharacterized protein LOC120842921 [Ixodes scapularis]|uniref:uncharacterized protein LOC120842921 n=1 Tax=Ixodes scapularis TaxID=6945 RepID=UPI001A9F5766|nr:uncharacterized protein LOC120842921 [Ixodes scapularis]
MMTRRNVIAILRPGKNLQTSSDISILRFSFILKMKFGACVLSFALAMLVGVAQGQYGVQDFVEGEDLLHRVVYIKRKLYAGINDLGNVYDEIKARFTKQGVDFKNSVQNTGTKLMATVRGVIGMTHRFMGHVFMSAHRLPFSHVFYHYHNHEGRTSMAVIKWAVCAWNLKIRKVEFVSSKL